MFCPFLSHNLYNLFSFFSRIGRRSLTLQCLPCLPLFVLYRLSKRAVPYLWCLGEEIKRECES
jgi:hypothetical protein